MKCSRLLWVCVGLLYSTCIYATNYYINTAEGNDKLQGTRPSKAWKSIAPLSRIQLKPGDSVLLAAGQTHRGMIALRQIHGSSTNPIVISGYAFQDHTERPTVDAGDSLNALLIQDASFIEIKGVNFTASTPYRAVSTNNKAEMRCGILVETTQETLFEQIVLQDVKVHDVYYHAQGFTRTAAEVKSANGTQSYGWGIRMINHSKTGKLNHVKVLNAEVYNVSHTGIKLTAAKNGINDMEIAHCEVYQTGGPGMQFSGITNGRIHHNHVDHSGSTADSRNWGRGSGMWTWSCSNIVIEYNRFENANGPGDSAGVHIDYNCSDVVVQYNVSANNAGGFCEILGNNYNCAYRYNISINDGFRVKGQQGAFQEGKIFWLSGYQGNEKKNAGPYNSYFYNNSIYVGAHIVPKIAVSSSASGVLIANNIFYFEKAAAVVAGDQKKKEIDEEGIANVVFTNNLYVHNNSWPDSFALQDAAPFFGNPLFKKNGGTSIADYHPGAAGLVRNKGIFILPIPQDSIGLRIGLQVKQDILGNKINGLPDIGAIELANNE